MANKNCNCLESIEKQTIEHVEKTLRERQTIHSINTEESGFVNQSWFFGSGGVKAGGGQIKLTLPVEVKYTPIKSNGEKGKEKTYKTNVLPSFCPFCGKKYS